VPWVNRFRCPAVLQPHLLGTDDIEVIKQRAQATILALALAFGSGCGGDDDSPSRGNGPASGAAAAQTPSPNGGPGGNGPGRNPGPGGRGPATITLASTDVTPVRRATVEAAVQITGNLQPVERIEVRARVEGEVEGVLVREGERVRAGQVMAHFDRAQQQSALESAEADRTSARTDLSAAQWNLDQTRELFKEGAVPERDVRAGEQAVASARARLAAAESRLRTATEALRDTRVVAPTSATVERRLVANGEHVNRGASLFTLVRTETLELTGAVPARVANQVTPGQNVRFMADARVFNGTVARVSPTIDPASRSVSVYVQIPNAGGSLKGGTFASGRIVSRTVENALVVPTSAIRQELNTGEPYVYRIDGENVERRPIQIGLIDEQGGIAEVTQGLEEGDRIVTGTVGTIARNAKVVIIGGEARRGGAPAVPRN
jgi:membrane fusion protein (multidrug efflux system)